MKTMPSMTEHYYLRSALDILQMFVSNFDVSLHDENSVYQLAYDQATTLLDLTEHLPANHLNEVVDDEKAHPAAADELGISSGA